MLANSDPELFARIMPEAADVLFGSRSLLSLVGREHLRQRKLLQPAFHGERMRGWAETIAEVGREVFGPQGPGTPESARELWALECAQTATLDVIVRVIFGVAEPERVEQFRGAVGPGDAIALSTLMLHFDPELWPEPERFDPERFLTGERPSPSVYVPFGGGARRCIGAAFSRFELAVLIGTLLRELDVELLERDVAWVRGSITMHPSSGVRLRVRRRDGA